MTSSAIDKIFEIFGPISEKNANVNFEPIFEQNANFVPIFGKTATFGPIIYKSKQSHIFATLQNLTL